MKFLPRNISTFSTMITGNYIYVDKTQHIYNLYSTGDRYHFLSRPRRFGKTLLISTLKELFSNNKKFFEGLWISTSNYEWIEYPVVHLDFALIEHQTPQQLSENIEWQLQLIAQQHTIDITSAPSAGSKLALLIITLAQRNKVAVLIDEYDYPLLTHLHDTEVAKKMQSILKSFYGVLKGLDPYLHAIFMTGITKFSKTSIFSGINNLVDITLTYEGAQLLGYTREEIEHYFEPYLISLGKKKQHIQEYVIDTLQTWYNGYRFSKYPIKVYNPYSVLNYLKTEELINYWFESATPSFLVHLLKTQYHALQDIEGIELSRYSLGTFEVDNIPLIALLFQTGYLTIVDYDQTNDMFKLSYPNKEVSESFKIYLVTILAHTSLSMVETTISQMVTALKDNDIDTFCLSLQSLFANIPYHLHIEQERYFHSLFQFLGSLLGLSIQSEVATDKGRADIVITTQTHIYIFELKFKIDPDIALQQIEKLRYYERYLIMHKPIVLIGLAFNYEDKKLTLDWRTKYLENMDCYSISKSNS
jgi:Predicted AAA-ATPase/PD-(D/E)XK nuclease superfamily